MSILLSLIILIPMFFIYNAISKELKELNDREEGYKAWFNREFNNGNN